MRSHLTLTALAFITCAACGDSGGSGYPARFDDESITDAGYATSNAFTPRNTKRGIESCTGFVESYEAQRDAQEVEITTIERTSTRFQIKGVRVGLVSGLDCGTIDIGGIMTSSDGNFTITTPTTCDSDDGTTLEFGGNGYFFDDGSTSFSFSLNASSDSAERTGRSGNCTVELGG